MLVRDLITEGMLPVSKTDSVGDALSLVIAREVKQLPVVDEERRLVGMVRLVSLLAIDDVSVKVGTLPFDAPISVSEDAHLYDAIELLAERYTDVLPVVSADGKYVGSVGLFDVLNPIARLLAVSSPGTIVEVEMSIQDFALRYLISSIEDSGVRILSVTTQGSDEDPMSVTVVLKLAVKDTSRVRAVIEHLGYRVVHRWGRETSDDELMHRVAEFMHYLDV